MKELRLTGVPAGATLSSIHVDNLPAMTTLKVEGARGVDLDLSGVGPLPQLEVLIVWSKGRLVLGDPSRFPSLRRLVVQGATDLENIAGLPALRVLHLDTADLPDLQPLAGLALDEMSVGGGLASLDGMPTLIKAPRHDYYKQRMEVLFRATRMPRLRSIRALATAVPGLTDLELQNTGIVSLEGVGELRQLIFLDVRNCPDLVDVSALDGLPDLRLVLANGTNLRKADFPKSIRWTVSTAKSPHVFKLMRRDPPGQRKKPAPAPLIEAPPAEDPLVDQIANGSEEARLVYMDVQLESGDEARAELVRVQVELAELPAKHRVKARELTRRAWALVKENHDRWVDPALGRFHFRRGFPDFVETTLDLLLQREDEIFAIPTLRGFALKKGLGIQGTRRLAASTALRRARYVSLRGPGMREACAELASSPGLADTEFFEISGEILSSSFANHLAKSPHLGAMETLAFRSSSFRGRSLQALAKTSLPKLHRLELFNNGLQGPATKALASIDLPALRELDLASCRLRAGGARALARGTLLAQLTWLNLSSNYLGAGLGALLDSGKLGNLVTFRCNRTDLNAASARRLASCADLANLQVLDLDNCKLDAQGLKALMASPHLSAELSIALHGAELTPDLLAALEERFGEVRTDGRWGR